MLHKYSHIIFILIFNIFILGFNFFFSSGTYVLLDYTLNPINKLRGFFEVSIFWHIHDILTMIFGYVLFSKFFFFLILFFTGFLGYKLAQIFLLKLNLDYKNTKIFSYTMIIFLLINPFFYERMITQPGVFLGVIFIGYGLYFLVKNIFLDYKNSNYIYSGIFFGLSFSLMNHALFMVLLIYLFYFLFFIRTKKSFLFLLLSGLIFILVNLNWLIGNFFLNTGNTLNYVNTINQVNVDNFTTNSLSGLGEEFTSLLLYGFWGERWHHFMLPEIINPKWFMAGTLIFIVVLYGIYLFLKDIKTRKIGLFLFLLGFISYILGVGVTAKWGFISQFLYDNIPFYIGLREPHKWIGILMLIYSIFFSFGIYKISLFFNKIFNFRYINALIIFMVFLFLNAWAPTIIGAFHGQLFMTNYPKEYFDFREKEISKNNIDNAYLVLPWHSYMSCSWSKRIVPNIMQGFMYPLHTINSDNIEVGTLYTNSSDSKSKDIEKFINNLDIDLLKKNNINHIIMLETCADFKKYKDILLNLEKMNLIEKEYISKELTSYKIK